MESDATLSDEEVFVSAIYELVSQLRDYELIFPLVITPVQNFPPPIIQYLRTYRGDPYLYE